MPELDRWENEGGSVSHQRIAARLTSLERAHAQLDQKVETEHKRPNPCGLELRHLKRQKLRLKDEMRQLGA